MSKSTQLLEPPEDENEKAKNHSNCQQKLEEGETEGEKEKNRQKQAKADTLDSFTLPDFLEEDDKAKSHLIVCA